MEAVIRLYAEEVVDDFAGDALVRSLEIHELFLCWPSLSQKMI
jgi:hypothetical protein